PTRNVVPRTLLDPARLLRAALQVVELGPSYLAHSLDFDLGYERGVERENPFHAYAVGYLPDDECLANAAALLGYDDAFEDLDPLPVPFLDFIMYGYGITGAKLRKIRPHHRFFYFQYYVHITSPSSYCTRKQPVENHGGRASDRQVVI